MAEELKWYVIHTYSGYENKVAQTILQVVENRGLQSYITDVMVPTTIGEELDKKGEKREVEIKTFPCYVFVHMILTDDTWYAVRNIRGVTGFVGPGSKPVPLTDKEVKRMQLEDKTKSNVEINFKVGDEVRINSGKMEGFIGKVSSINLDDMTVEVQISYFNRITPCVVEINQVDKTEN